MILEIPQPAAVLLVGAAGAGKSTFASIHFPGDAIISSDALRAGITGDAANQAANRRVFAAVHEALEARLAAGRIAVVDATNITAAGRRAIRIRAADAGAPVIAIVLALPADIVLRQNGARPGRRRVPDAVVARHLAALEGLLERGVLDTEGYAMLVTLRDPDAVRRVTVRVAERAAVDRGARRPVS